MLRWQSRSSLQKHMTKELEINSMTYRGGFGIYLINLPFFVFNISSPDDEMAEYMMDTSYQKA